MSGSRANLDHKRSYGTVYGHPQIGYEQEGQQFKHDGTVWTPEPPKPAVAPAASVDVIPAAPVTPATSPEVLKALEGLSSQLKDLKEPKGPDPARSEAARKIWADRRAREAEVTNEAPDTSPAQP